MEGELVGEIQIMVEAASMVTYGDLKLTFFTFSAKNSAYWHIHSKAIFAHDDAIMRGA